MEREDASSNIDTGTPIDFFALCCDARCDFDLSSGDIEHGVPTWHAHDPGLGLIGDLVMLTAADEQAGPGNLRPNCYEVEVMADKDPGASLQLEIDVLGNGENILSQAVSADNWSISRFEYKAPTQDGEMRFTLKKQGTARAVLYFIEIDGIYECSSDAVVVAP